jgi:hypothetical protein
MTLVYLLIALPFIVYLGFPLVIKATLKLNARPQLQPLTPKYAPDDVKEYFEQVGPRLASLGFEQEACFTIENAVPNVTSHVALCINRTSGQAAAASVMITQPQGDKPPVVKSHVEFLTRLATGQAVTTSNSQDLGAFKPTRDTDALSAPGLTDMAQLYQLHQWRDSKLVNPSAERFLPAPGAALDWFAQGYEESIARQVKTGYVQADPSDSTTYTPTIQGAYAMTWAQLPPMKQMRRGAEEKRAASQTRQALANPAQPANVRITHQRTDTAPTRRAA